MNRKKENRVEDVNRIITDDKDSRKGRNELYLFSCDVVDFENVLSSSKQYSLDTFVVIDQPGITSLEGISKLVNLRELWIVECLVQDLSDIEKCERLEALYLYSNNIKDIPNMSKSVELKILSLSGNSISLLKNLHTIPNLKEFHIANNRLKTIGNSFSENRNIVSINFAGNPLYRLEDIRSLFFLKKLHSIVFADPMYGECPLVSVSNYRYFVINYLRNLNQLDHYPISNEERSYSMEFFKSKLMFYNMLNNNYLDDFTKYCQNRVRERWKRIDGYREEMYAMKTINESDSVGEKSKELKFNKILQKIHHRIKDDEAEDQLCTENSVTNFQILQQKLRMNIEHCGNIRFIEYLPGIEKSVVKICEDMCNDSLCRTMRQDLGISKVLVHRVTKVVNNETNALRASRISFDKDKDQDESIFKFLVDPVGVLEIDKWPFEIFEKEFLDAREILITDCLAIADADWMKNISNQRFLPSSKSCLKHRVAVLIQLANSALITRVEEPDDYHNCQRHSVVELQHVKPVFAVEYEYIFQNDVEEEVRKLTKPICMKSSPETLARILNSDDLSRCLNSRDLDIEKLVVIDISGRGICAIDLSTSLPNLREFNLSYNKLTKLPNSVIIEYVRKLDVSFNDISSFDITTTLLSMESLNFSWNRATRFITILETLEAFTPVLTNLDLKHNPFVDVTDTRSTFLLTKDFLPKLKYLNENSLEDFVPEKSVYLSPCVIDIFENDCVISEPNKSLTSFCVGQMESDNVEVVNLSGNELRDFDNLATEFPKLREIYLSNNLLTKVLLRKTLDHLTRLNIRSNFILTTDGLTQKNLPVINYIDLSDNLITSLISMDSFNSLNEFYSTHNDIKEISQIYNLKNWKGVRIINLSNNPMDSMDMCDKFITFHIAKIEYVNSKRVTAADVSEANQAFGGSLDEDKILEMYSTMDLTHLKKLSLVNCALKKVDLPAGLLPNLESLDLSQNQITTLWYFGSLKRLKVLCLSRNQVQTSAPMDRKKSIECLFLTLETLFLDHNGIRSLIDFYVQSMPSLRHLYLQWNDLKDVNGLEKCNNLETVVLDHNKIHIITEEDFHPDNNMKTLFLENNKIKYLSFAKRLSKVIRLFISNNKINDKDQLNNLEKLENLKEVTILGNPLCKRNNHYKFVVQILPTLTKIDGHSVILNEYS